MYVPLDVHVAHTPRGVSRMITGAPDHDGPCADFQHRAAWILHPIPLSRNLTSMLRQPLPSTFPTPHSEVNPLCITVRLLENASRVRGSLPGL